MYSGIKKGYETARRRRLRAQLQFLFRACTSTFNEGHRNAPMWRMRVMARGRTADSRASRPRQDVPSLKRTPIPLLTAIAAEYGGPTSVRRETAATRSSPDRETFPCELRSIVRINPLPLASRRRRRRRDVLGRSSVVYNPELWLVRWSAPGTTSRWSCSARDASARPRSPSDTSRTSSTTSISPRYRWSPPPPPS